MRNTQVSHKTAIRRIAAKSLLTAAAISCAVLSQSSHARAMDLFGGNLAWYSYGYTFTSAYNSNAMNMYLTEFQNANLNYIRVWVCENFDGISFDSSGNANGISTTLLNNVANFCSMANAKGITVELVFLNYMDVQSRPGVVGNNRTAMINNALVPLGKKVQAYNCRIDLINEGNVATNVASWSTLRAFCAQAISALHSNGVNRWITMSDQYAPDYTTYFSSTVGGLGFNFYEYHDYNGDGSIPVSSSNVGGARIELNEFGPGAGWNNQSYSTNKSVLSAFVNNAKAKGYSGAAFWSYIGDTNFQLRGNTLMGDMAYWGRNK